MLTTCLLALLAQAAPAAAPDAAPAAPVAAPAPPANDPAPPANDPAPADPQLAAALAAALAADAAAVSASAPPPPAPAAPSAAPGLLNPETSVILIGSGAWRRDAEVAPFFQAHDDPALDRLSLQEIELTFAGDVDPYFKLRLFLALPSDGGIEVEEGYVTSSALPFNLQLKAGIFRSAFGRNNEQHLHVQDFARRPRTTRALGEDGLRAPGVQGSVLLPLPWYTVLWGEALSRQERKASSAFGLDQFFDVSAEWSLLLGLSGASLSPADAHEHEHGADETDVAIALEEREAVRRELVGADLYLKWRPVNVTETYWWFAFTAEAMVEKPRHQDALGLGYAQLVAQVARRVRLGVRADVSGLPRAQGLPRELGLAGSLAFLPTEFSRVRLTYQHERDVAGGTRRNDTFVLQLEATIGAHGAHPF